MEVDVGEKRETVMNGNFYTMNGELPVFSRLALCLAILCVWTAWPEAISGQTENPDKSAAALPEIAVSLYLGQAYDSGRLYVEGGFRLRHPSLVGTEQEWPEQSLFRPLDADALGATGLLEPTPARFRDSQLLTVSPRFAEGVLDVAVGSPCVTDDYTPSEDARYIDRTQQAAGWDVRDFFGTNEYTWCGDFGVFGIYEIQGQPMSSFRAVAYDADLAIGPFNYELAGTPRPLTPADIEALARLEERKDCTLRLRSVAEARELLRFQTETQPFTFRLSSHVEACTMIHEVFILEALDGEEVVERIELVKIRAYP